MNSRLVVGVGNIYASEALFRARIRPRRQARSLSRAECAKLARAIKATLAMAVKVGGTTLRDYVGADGNPGYFRQKLYVYERAGDAVPRVSASPSGNSRRAAAPLTGVRTARNSCFAPPLRRRFPKWP